MAAGLPGIPPSIMVGGGATGDATGDSTGGSPTAGDGDWEQDLQNVLADLRKLAADAQDHIEANTVDKCIAALSALTSSRQKGAESALGVTPAHKAMSRSY